MILAFVFLATMSWQQQVDAQLAKEFPKLARLESRAWEIPAVLYYDSDRARVVNRKRSTYPQNDPLYAPADEPSGDDVILVRMRDHYVAFTAGASADPAFYLLSPDGETDHELHFGATVMAIPAENTFLTFGRYNSMFVEKRLYRLAGGKPVEVKQPFLHVGLTSAAVKVLTLRARIDGGDVVAEVAPGDPVEVLVSDGDGNFLIKTKLGLTGWTKIELTQEAETIKDLWYAGD